MASEQVEDHLLVECAKWNRRAGLLIVPTGARHLDVLVHGRALRVEL